MNIAITGGSGFIGTAVSEYFARDHRVVQISRGRGSGPNSAHWDPGHGAIDASKLEGLDAVIHLAGENIAGGRWTEQRKVRIRDSRVRGTTLLCNTLAGLRHPPRRLLCASAVGYYGNRGDEILTEASAPGDDFLAGVCREWESAAAPASAAGIAVANMRFGLVLSRRGGMLAKMMTPFKLGLGAVLGDGRQYMSWVALEDVVGAMAFLLSRDDLTGPVNVVAPDPVTNGEFTRSFAAALHRPALLRAPAFALKLALGELADAMLSSQRALPERLIRAGYAFKHARLPDAFNH